MSIFRALLITSLAMLAQACKTLAKAPAQPALMPVKSESALVELRQTLKNALNGREVTIADNAFENSHRLLLERKKAIGPDGRPIQTRVDEAPIIFELYLAGDTCYLQEVNRDQQYPLTQAKCETKVKE